uniref:Uncharacterized protein n=1 Tax=Arundo donax TaxID=35708 RepID=A0A0A9G5W9_ARUDO
MLSYVTVTCIGTCDHFCNENKCEFQIQVLLARVNL